MMHTRITPSGLSADDQAIARTLIERLDELARNLDALSGLAFELRSSTELSRPQACAMSSIEFISEQLCIEAQAVSDRLALMVPGAERVGGA